MSDSSRGGSRKNNDDVGNRSASSDRDDSSQGRISHIEHSEESYCLDVFPEGGATLELKRQTTRVVREQDSATINLESAPENVGVDPPRSYRSWQFWLRTSVVSAVEAVIRRLQSLL